MISRLIFQWRHHARRYLSAAIVLLPLHTCCGYTNIATQSEGAGERLAKDSYVLISSWPQFDSSFAEGMEYKNRSGFSGTYTFLPLLDSDGDGLCNEDDPDNDNDGISDEDEITGVRFTAQRPTDPNNPDSDGDGVSDGNEAVAGTDPNDRSSVFTIGSLTAEDAGPFSVSLHTTQGRQYIPAFTDSRTLSNVLWQCFSNQTEGIGRWTETNPGGQHITFVDDYSTNTSGRRPEAGRFYRINVINTGGEP